MTLASKVRKQIECSESKFWDTGFSLIVIVSPPGKAWKLLCLSEAGRMENEAPTDEHLCRTWLPLLLYKVRPIKQCQLISCSRTHISISLWTPWHTFLSERRTESSWCSVFTTLRQLSLFLAHFSQQWCSYSLYLLFTKLSLLENHFCSYHWQVLWEFSSQFNLISTLSPNDKIKQVNKASTKYGPG